MAVGLGDSDSPSVGVIVSNPLPGSGVVKAGVGARVEYFGGRVGMTGFPKADVRWEELLQGFSKGGFRIVYIEWVVIECVFIVRVKSFSFLSWYTSQLCLHFVFTFSFSLQ